ncbi:uncharacterized protein LOC143782231 isoform X2 [Ranitomeya variabilis]|uniref:uncharacterized protein LOC143782231 isoform X2 n=1 Tax=Ranitomeya variabilis TaxID=490064 RepID=UPI0040566CE7
MKQQIKSELEEILERAFLEGVITKELRTHLIPVYPKTACIYFTPKIHKSMTAPPGRPIVSGNGSLCEAESLSMRFHDRGYSRRSIKRGLHKATRMTRSTLMNPKMKPPTEQKVRFISTYTEQWSEMRNALKKFWPLLQTDKDLKRYLPNHPSITYRRSSNLKDQLVHSYYAGPKIEKAFGSRGQKWGCFPCKNCIACPNIDHASTFTSSDGKKTFTITQHITCNTTGVIYYAQCPCPKVYVGLTSRALKIRVREHHNDIIKAKEVEDTIALKSLARHFKTHHNSNARLLKVIGIDKVYVWIKEEAIRGRILHSWKPAGSLE